MFYQNKYFPKAIYNISTISNGKGQKDQYTAACSSHYKQQDI